MAGSKASKSPKKVATPTKAKKKIAKKTTPAKSKAAAAVSAPKSPKPKGTPKKSALADVNADGKTTRSEARDAPLVRSPRRGPSASAPAADPVTRH